MISSRDFRKGAEICRADPAKRTAGWMTLRDFENGYWYLDQLKNFAERIGPSCEEAAKTRLRSFSRKITWLRLPRFRRLDWHE